MHTKSLLASIFLVALSACQGECSCGTTGSDDDGEGGSDGDTTSVGVGGAGGATTVGVAGGANIN